MLKPSDIDFAYLRDQSVGMDSVIRTPFGDRLMVYCDYTASGRNLSFIERYLQDIQRQYANTHTEDDITGRSMTRLMDEAERIIKEAVNAGPQGRIIPVGTGATAAIDKFQQLVGVAVPPATWQLISRMFEEHREGSDIEAWYRFIRERQPVIIVGPFEHHSNEVTWRQGLATVITTDLNAEGQIDLDHLEEILTDSRSEGRLMIGSFSAASNVTGMLTPVHEIARILHRHGALACFDYAACAPYVKIDMNPPVGETPAGNHTVEEGDPSLDAVFISPHKFLGGPGSTGVLVFNERIYHTELPPTVGGGGTVDYVGADDHDFMTDIEEREKAGTPGVLQIMKAALAFMVKEGLSVEAIEEREAELTRRAFTRWQENPFIEILGNPDPAKRVCIISFNVLDPRGRYLHPKFVTVLLNDLFGIQSRAGCSCAGPYGHRLLGIDDDTSERFREWVREGYQGIKPGWCRVGLHYVMDDTDVDYILDAIDFTAREGSRFLPLYEFEPRSGAWSHHEHEEVVQSFSLEHALKNECLEPESLSENERRKLYAGFIEEARTLAEGLPLPGEGSGREEADLFGDLRFFTT